MLTAPASYAQSRLWFLDQYEPDTSLYNIGRAFRLRGTPDIGALEWALGEVIRRHETLRTTFLAPSGEPLQAITSPAGFELRVTDLRGVPRGGVDEAAWEWLDREQWRPYDLASGPLFRAGLLRLSDEESWLSLAMHHIVSDEWSLQILNRELTALYAARCSGAPSPLPELSLQYRDYDVWQRGWLAAGALKEQLEYWRGRLAGAPAVLELPTDQPRPSVQTHNGAEQNARFPMEILSDLQSICRSAHASPFMGALSCWAILLHRLSQQDEVVIGTPIANRQRVEWEDLIGFLVNTLPLRVDLRGNPTFLEALGRVRSMALEAYDHQDLPFERLVEELRPVRSLSYSPVFQTMFRLRTVPLTPLALQGVEVTPLLFSSPVTRWELSASLAASPEGLEAHLLYNAGLFSAASASRLLDALHNLLKAVVSSPNERIGSLDVLSPDQRRQVLVSWNPPRFDLPCDLVHSRFASLAQRNPAAPAITARDVVVTHATLNARANRLAHFLMRHGVGPEKLVGVCMEACPEQVVALLGILKAGAAFVPIDPQFPDERLRYLLADSACVVVLTQAALEGRVRNVAHGLERPPLLLSLDTAASLLESESNQDPDTGVGPENLAYVLYTSGSTGKPKGVMIEHRNLSSYLAWINSELTPDGRPQMPFTTRLSFDACLKQVLGPLVCGRDVWLVPPETTTNAPRLIAELRTRHPSAFSGVPTLWKSLLDAIEADPSLAHGPGLTHVFLGGESLDADTVQRTRRLLPQVTMWNIYGPTETTPNAAAGRLADDGLVPVGRPVANARLYILDRNLQPVLPGHPGELFIGGVGVGRGYWQRPDLTAERFVPDPFCTEPGQRLYRTGDRCRHLADGRIEFLGRADYQVKLRGYRIELGEIEHALRDCAGVKDAIALLLDEPGKEKRLAACVVFAGARPPERQELLDRLHKTLPSYMVPAQFVLLRELPRLPSGKVDRQALLRLEVSEVAAATCAAPSSRTENLIAQIWQDLLQLERVDVNESFFDLGGHSLLAMQVVARLRHALGVTVPLRTLFQHPTVAGLARAIDQMGAARSGRNDDG